MENLKFLQIHSLHGYPAVLLNRDDSGLAKRLKYGGRLRTRISSQCLKRHWRMANDENNLKHISGVTAASRSREIVTRKVIDPLRKDHEQNSIDSIEKAFQISVYGSKGDVKSSRQPLLLGEPEIKYLAKEAKNIAKQISEANEESVNETLNEWRENNKKIVDQLRISADAAASFSGEVVTRKVIDPLKEKHDPNLIELIEKEFYRFVYGDKGDVKSSHQSLLLSKSEIEFLAKEVKNIAKQLSEAYENNAKKILSEWRNNYKSNMKQLRDTCKLPGGLVSALFGRMVTSDPEANIDAAIHVAHAFTIHEEESESDYFSVVDDLQRIEDESGADHIGETELTSGIFYGYVVVDRDILLDNLSNDKEMACEIVRRLVHLIAKVTPGAKLGSTAPYEYASWMLIEAGDCQPRSLAEAFRKPCEPNIESGEKALNEHIKRLDETYGCNEIRRFLSLTNSPIQNALRLTLPELAEWTGQTIQTGKM